MSVLQTIGRYWDAFACSAENAVKARKEVTHFASRLLSDIDLGDLELAVGEVLSNVVQHARSYWMAVHCYRDGDRFVTEVWNYGDGFAPPQKFALPATGALRGYGLFLMYTLLDELEFFDHGRHIRLVKRLAQSPPFQR